VKNVIKRPEETLASIPGGSVITVLPAVQTVAQLRQQEEGRWLFSLGNALLPGSAAVVPGIVKAPVRETRPRDFIVNIPGKAPRLWSFDFDTTIAEACRAITDDFGISFPPYALFVRDFMLSNKEFLFDVSDGTIDVRPVLGEPNVYRTFSPAHRRAIGHSGNSIEELRRKLTPIFSQPIHLVSGGKLLRDGVSLADARVTPDRFLYVYEQRPPPGTYGDRPIVHTTFDFAVASARGSTCSLPYNPHATVGQAKIELARKLGKRRSDMTVIDTVQMICLEDSDNLASFVKPGRPFTVAAVDMSLELKEDAIRLIRKYLPNKRPVDGKLLFLQCLGHPQVFQRTCKHRGYI
jgi:hypothetical protein